MKLKIKSTFISAKKMSNLIMILDQQNYGTIIQNLIEISDMELQGQEITPWELQNLKTQQQLDIRSLRNNNISQILNDATGIGRTVIGASFASGAAGAIGGAVGAVAGVANLGFAIDNLGVKNANLKLKQDQELAKAQKEILRVNRNMKKSRVNYSFSTDSNNFMINDKKVKVTKKIIIRVPKNATFDLNTRHCKVKLPKTKASGKVSYGTFKADVLNGGKLNVSYSPVTINSLNACTLFLNNVTDAHVASVANTVLNTNSSGVIVDNVYNNVEVINKFGELTIRKIHSNHNNLKVFLNYSSAGINSLEIGGDLKFDVNDKMRTLKNGDIKFNGDFIITSKNKKVEIKGKYSQLTLKKQ